MAEDALRVTFGADISGSEEQIKKDLTVILGKIEGSEEAKITLGAKLGSDSATELQKQLNNTKFNIDVDINDSGKKSNEVAPAIQKIVEAEKQLNKEKEKSLIISENEIKKAEEILFLAQEYKKARKEMFRLEKINPAKWTEQNDKERNKAYKLQTDNGKLAKELLGEITELGYNIFPKGNHPNNIVDAIEQWATTVTDIGIGVEVTPNLVVNKAELLKEATQVTTEIKEAVTNTSNKISTTSSDSIATPAQNNEPVVQPIALEISEESANKIVTDVTAIVRQLETDVTTKMAFGMSEESTMQIRADIENAIQNITLGIGSNTSQTPQSGQGAGNSVDNQIKNDLQNAAVNIEEGTKSTAEAAKEFKKVSEQIRTVTSTTKDGETKVQTIKTTTGRSKSGKIATVVNSDNISSVTISNSSVNKQLETVESKLEKINLLKAQIADGEDLEGIVSDKSLSKLNEVTKQIDAIKNAIATGDFSQIDSIDDSAQGLNKINVLLSKANGIVKEIETSVKKTTAFQDNLDNATTKVADLRNKASKIAPDAELNNQLNQLHNLAEYLGGKGWGNVNVYGNEPESLEDARIAYTKLAAEVRNTIALKTNEQAAEARSANIRTQSNKILKEATNYYEQHQSGIGKNAALQAKWNSLIDKFKSGSFNGDLKAMRAELAELQTETKAAGAETDALWFQLKKLFTDHFGALVATAVLGNAKQVFADMYQRVVDIDTAMTELKKVTNLTAAEYEKFGETAEQAAKKVGGSIADTITSTADFTRLGYDVADASSLAQAALVYKNVGDGLEDVNEASESIISTMKGFGIEAADAMSIVDKFNTTGNKFAISSQGVGEALRRSAASLNAARNSLEESIALVTVGNNVIQDPDSVGKSLPNNVVIRCKLATISVKSWGQLRPRKDFVIYNKSDFAKFDICNQTAA